MAYLEISIQKECTVRQINCIDFHLIFSGWFNFYEKYFVLLCCFFSITTIFILPTFLLLDCTTEYSCRRCFNFHSTCCFLLLATWSYFFRTVKSSRVDFLVENHRFRAEGKFVVKIGYTEGIILTVEPLYNFILPLYLLNIAIAIVYVYKLTQLADS